MISKQEYFPTTNTYVEELDDGEIRVYNVHIHPEVKKDRKKRYRVSYMTLFFLLYVIALILKAI